LRVLRRDVNILRISCQPCSDSSNGNGLAIKHSLCKIKAFVEVIIRVALVVNMHAAELFSNDVELCKVR